MPRNSLTQVELEFTGKLIDITGKRRDIIILERPVKLAEIVSLTASKYGEKFQKAIFSEKELVIVLLINGAMELNMAREVGNGDKVVFLTPVAGG